jgi:glutamate-1-semialdehyde 2,1-aminomutase
MASGYPISVLVGKRRLMEKIADGRVIHAGTMNSGNPSVAAAQATLRVLEGEAIHPRLFDLGRRLMEGLRDSSKRAGNPLLVQGPGPMFHTGFTTLERIRDYRETLTYDKPRYGAFVAEMQERGIRLIGRGLWYISAAHTTEEIDLCVATAYEVLKAVS